MAAEELEPLFGGSSTPAKAERELEPLKGCSALAAQWLSVDSGAASAFLVNLGCTTGSSGRC